ncbi:MULTISPECIES: hypothetical protein [unclassified Nocardioides]|uniref:hypothetical protein n=1 Tax=unclassified Nocardioides TaxID=2615069 RepID=UPI000702DBC1|nr:MULTISPECIES: hypothetical protein [unclassified Nocardioides]KRC54696.1 hypothetical protein ASE19_04230 [Nocardioides sp. Root79]KRC73958.1 hypothetical protein ASE20_04985 [Nocardioides sp. Root240]
MFLVFAFILAGVVAPIHQRVIQHAPTSRIVRQLRRSQRRLPGVAAAMALGLGLITFGHLVQVAISSGAPAALYGAVLILMWDGIKLNLLGVAMLTSWLGEQTRGGVAVPQRLGPSAGRVGR